MFSASHYILCSRILTTYDGRLIASGSNEPEFLRRRVEFRQLLERFRREDREQKRQEREAERARSLQHTGQAGHPVA